MYVISCSLHRTVVRYLIRHSVLLNFNVMAHHNFVNVVHVSEKNVYSEAMGPLFCICLLGQVC